MKETTKRFHLNAEGWHTVTPRIVVHEAKQLVEFLQQVFGAAGEYREARPSEVRIGDSVIMISDAGTRSPMTAFLYVYVSDTDARIDSSRCWCALSKSHPSRLMVTVVAWLEDKWGNTWQIATYMGDRDDA